MFTNRRVPLRSARRARALRREGGALGCASRGGRSSAFAMLRRTRHSLGGGGRFARAAGTLLVLLALCAPAFAQEPADLVEGRRLFDALEYDQALPFLDRAISALEPQASRDPASRTALISAFEMRARARFGIGNREGAVADFRALLGLEPGFVLPEGVSPRVVAILDEVRVATIGSVELTLDPLDAQLVVDGVPRPVGNGRLAVAAGAHTLRVSRIGYRPIDQPVTVLAGQNLPLRVALERTASVVTMVTTPPGAEVFVNGVSKGRTDPTVAASATAAAAAQLQVPVAQLAALGADRSDNGDFRRRVPTGLLRHRAAADLDRRAGRSRHGAGDPQAVGGRPGARKRASRCDRAHRRRCARRGAGDHRRGLRGHARHRVPQQRRPLGRTCLPRTGRQPHHQGPRPAWLRAAQRRSRRGGRPARRPSSAPSSRPTPSCSTHRPPTCSRK